MDVGFVIPVFNQVDYTTQCLASLNSVGVADQDIVIVDNASTDGTRDFLRARPKLRVITNETNRGCAVAWNQGVEASTAKWIVVLNNDVVVAPSFCEGLVGFAEETGYDIVSPAKGEGELDYDFLPFAKGFLGKMASVTRDGVASGSGFMVHRRVFEKIGLFDPKVGLAGTEDEDFFRRARSAGFRLAITGRAYLHHFSSVTQKSLRASLGLSSKTRLFDREYFCKKHNLTWWRRQTDRIEERTRTALWRWKESRRFDLTLKMTRRAGQWRLE